MRTKHHQAMRGMTLVELMVGLVIGMIVVLVIFQIETTFEGQKRTTTEGAGAQENGLYSVSTMERDIRMAGWGIANTPLLGCTTGIVAVYNGTPIANFSLMPVKIIDHGTAPDEIYLMSGTSQNAAAPSTVTKPLGGGSAEVDVSSVVGFNANDMVLVVNPDGTCNYGQVTHVQSSGGKLQRNPGLSLFDVPGGAKKATFYPEVVNGKIYDLGATIQRNYAISAAQLTATDFNASTLTVADNIVSMKAQYGITAGGGSQVVTSWVNATGTTWAAPAAADVARIKAIRLFVVARSPLVEKPNTSGVCTTTTSATAPSPTWTGGDAISIDLSGTTNWQCFRYKSFQTIIPLRNVLWANS